MNDIILDILENERGDEYEGILEMAQQHFDNRILNMIKNGKYKEAAEEYMQNMRNRGYKVSATPGGTIKKLRRGDIKANFGGDAELAKQISDSQWTEFESAYKEIAAEQGIEKKYGTGTPEGGRTHRKDKEKGMRKKYKDQLRQIKKEIEYFKNVRSRARTNRQKQDAEEAIEGLKVLARGVKQIIDTGQAPLKDDPERIQKRRNLIKKKFADPEKQEVKSQDDEDMEEIEAEPTEKEREAAFSEIRRRTTGVPDFEDDEENWREWHRQKKEREKRDVPSVPENLRQKENMLKEAYGYEGVYFWENFTGSFLVKMFNEDVKRVGPKKAKNLYTFAFGKESEPLFEEMASEPELLNEAANIKADLLFENQGNINEAITKGPASGGGVIPAGVGAGSKGGILSFLSGIWSKIKEFGGGAVEKLSAAAASGLSWARELASKGMGALAEMGIPSAVVPAVAIAGSAAGAIALINKARKKKKKKELSQQEKEKIRELAKQKESQINKAQDKIDDGKEKLKQQKEQQQAKEKDDD